MQSEFHSYSTLAYFGGIRPFCNCLLLQLSPPYTFYQKARILLCAFLPSFSIISKAFFVVLPRFFYTALYFVDSYLCHYQPTHFFINNWVTDALET